MKNMTTKKIDKIIIYYNDGTFEEVKTSVHDVADKQNPLPSYTPSKPDVTKYPPLYYPTGVRGLEPPYTVTCGLAGVLPPSIDKYTITTNSTGNVDFSKNSGREFT